jgi:23S rRNA (pseudouridine1915-N3)-methyltransferase
MRIHLIAVGTRMPGWVTQGYLEYARRLPRECRLELTEVSAGKRGKTVNTAAVVAGEGHRLLAAAPERAQLIALDERGTAWDTAALAGRLQDWLQDGRDVALLVGGADGLSPDCLEQADQRWSLSVLTLPHALVRVIVAEQLYRAWTLLTGHPYHRA